VRFDVVANVLVEKVKREMISISVNDSVTWEKFWVDRVKGWKDFVEVYRRHFCWRFKPLDELPSIFIHLKLKRGYCQE